MFNCIKKYIQQFYIIILAVLGLTYIGTVNYLLFHTIVEAGKIVLGYMIIVVIINNKKNNTEEGSFQILGISYGFITFFVFLHVVFYKGMGFFPITSSNLSTQIYKVSQFIEVFSLLLFVGLYRSEKIKIKLISITYLFITCIAILSLFVWGNFPASYIDGVGLTSYSKNSELFTNIILLLVVVLLILNRNKFIKDTFRHLLCSIIFTICAGIFFMLFNATNDSIALIGHICKVISFYFMYKAIVQVKIISPQLESKYNEQRYYNLVQLLPEAVFVHNAGVISLTNPAGLRILDLKSYDQLLGKSLWDFIDFQDMQNKEIPILKDHDFTIVQHGGKRVEVKMTTTPYDEESTMIIIHNISEQKKAERLKLDLENEEQKLRIALEFEQLKSNFYINITHEFKTPLNILLGIVQLFEKDLEKIPEYWGKYVPIAKQNCYRLWRLMDNLIDISKINTNSFDIDLTNNDIVEVVEEIALSVADYIKESNISITFDTDVEERVIACDPELMERILLNLLSNGVKFSKDKGNILVNLIDGVDCITIEIEDEGIGIPESKVDTIFNSFAKVDDSLTRDNEGCGMGLAIASALVEMHGGSIEAHSKIGQGSKFTIKIPVKKCEISNIRSYNKPTHQEKINIEFSDIYSLSS